MSYEESIFQDYMRIYRDGLTLRTPAVELLKIYNSYIFNSGKKIDKFDRKVIWLLLIEFVGLDDITDGKQPEPNAIELMKCK